MNRSKIYYNSTIARITTWLQGYSTIMLFGMIFTEKDRLKDSEKVHEITHVHQYWDCFKLGIGIISFILILYMICTLSVPSYSYLWLTIIPVILYYVWYLLEYSFYRYIRKRNQRDSYRSIRFEKQARYMENDWVNPGEKTPYTFLSWLDY